MFSTCMLSRLPAWLLFAGLVSSIPTTPSKPGKRDPEQNVLGGQNFPDPAVFNLNGMFYVYSTTSAGMNIPMSSNPDFDDDTGWAGLTDAFPSADVPAFNNWAAPTSSWAPSVHQLTDGDNSFAMYYAPALQGSSTHCIGLARNPNSVTGPYNDSSTDPLICPIDDGGAIDPFGFLDQDNTRYLLYKIDGPQANGGGYCANGQPVSNTSLMLQQTANDGYTMIGDPVVLWNNQGEADGYNTEAPTLVLVNGVYFLFFSTGCYTDNSYTTKYVTSTVGVRGPYGDVQTLLKQGSYGDSGPGGADITSDGVHMVFHSLINGDINQGRQLNTATMSYDGTTASID